MRRDFDHSKEEGLRSQQRAKRRKTNLVLNALIGIVIILIVIVSFAIFSGGDKKQDTAKNQTTETNASSSEKTGEESQPKSQESAAMRQDEAKTDKSEADETEKDKSEAETDENKTNLDDSQVVSEGGGENVEKTLINPDWEAVGTNQTGPYSSNSVDWDERVQALAYAIGTDPFNMTVWYLGRSGEQQSVGTVSAKGNDQAYRVYLEWENGEGWKPVKVEELVENDKQ